MLNRCSVFKNKLCYKHALVKITTMDHQTLQNECKWITKEYFETILSKFIKDSTIQVQEYYLSSPLKKGENYASQIIKALIKYSTEATKNASMSVIIKKSLINKQINDSFDMDTIFQQETYAYKHIIPEVEELLAHAVKIAPSAIAANISPTYIILEDLSVQNFKNADRRLGLDFQHLKLCLTTLAKWHAGTAYIGTKEPQKFEKFHKPLVGSHISDFNIFFTNAVEALINTASTWPGFEKIVKKLEQFQPNGLCEKIKETFVQSNRFNVLTHGDAWVNNIMYKNDDNGNPIDVIMIDFSSGFWGSPGIDLSYLLFTSSNDSVREKQWDELLQHYHEVLITALNAVKYSKRIPTLTDIHVEFLEKAMYAVGISLSVTGLRKMPNSENAKLESLVGVSDEDKTFQKSITEVEGFRETMEFLLKFYDRKGFLN